MNRQIKVHELSVQSVMILARASVYKNSINCLVRIFNCYGEVLSVNILVKVFKYITCDSLKDFSPNIFPNPFSVKLNTIRFN